MTSSSRQTILPPSPLSSARLRPDPTSLLPAVDGYVSAKCERWLKIDSQVEHDGLRWADAEARLRDDPLQRPATAQMKKLEKRLGRLDSQKAVLMQEIVSLPAGGTTDAAAKLGVLERLLAGEGGHEHRLLSDALSKLGITNWRTV